jgi:hypothetical protein
VRALFALAAATLTLSPGGLAVQPVAKTESPADLARGQASGIAVTRRGRLYAVPRLEPLGLPFPAPEPGQVWSITADTEGNVFLGTGPDGRILKIDRSGKTSLLATIDEPMVTALSIDRQGKLYAAAAPGGSIYRIDRDGTSELFSETGESYVWVLVPAGGGKFFAGTGERGRVLVIGPAGRADLLFDGDESHIVSLVPLPDGELLAGGAGRGLVYRVDREGRAIVLHDDDLSEVVALATDGDAVIAALVASLEPESRHPALRLRLPEGRRVGAASEGTEILDDAASPTLQGFIEGIGRSEAPVDERVRGRVVRIEADGSVVELWHSTRHAPYSLTTDDRRDVLFGAGEPGHLYRIGDDGDVAKIATLEEAQVTGLLATSSGLVVATANPGRAYRLPERSAGPGEFISLPIDAGGIARWGSIAWDPPDAAGAELYTRTGSSRTPDETWSGWSPALRDGSGSRVVNPDGRFLQWRLRQPSTGRQSAGLGEVTVIYEPYNRSPWVFEFRAGPQASDSIRGPVEFRWKTRDPDGDTVEVTVEYRTEGAGAWDRVGAQRSDGGADEGGEGLLVWDTASIEEGEYSVRALASDQPANPRGEGRQGSEPATLRLILDRTPPRVELLTDSDGTLLVTLEDRLSRVRPLELLRDGQVRFTARPKDGVCDSRKEAFRLDLPDGAVAGWSVRGIDAAGNAVERSLAEGGGAN